MSNECKIEKIILKIDDKKIELSMDQIKKLKSLLDDIFKKETVYIPAPYKEYIPLLHEKPYNPWPSYPWVTYCSNTTIECKL